MGNGHTGCPVVARSTVKIRNGPYIKSACFQVLGERSCVFTNCVQVDLPAQKAANEDIPRAMPRLIAFEMKRKANTAENQALLNQIAPPMETPPRQVREKGKQPATPPTPPNPTRRSERTLSARRTV
jgi:hypothetical protein